MKEVVLGIDVGGTNIKFGLVDPSGRVIAKTSLLTKGFVRNKNFLIDALVDCGIGLLEGTGLKKNDVKGVGIGFPGIVDFKKGFVATLTNIPGWKNIFLRDILQKKFHWPVLIDNDVNLIALGEWKFGAGRGVNDLVCIALGTGVGGGLILDGRLYRGASFAAGEVGHMPLNEEGLSCNCGGWGCLERFVGNKYLLQDAQKIFKTNISLEEITRLATHGNLKAIRFWKTAATHIGNGLVTVVNLLNPQCIIMGGGVANAHPFLLPTIRKIIQQRAMKVPAKIVKILPAKLGADAGLVGAQVLMESAFKAENQ